MNTQNNVFEINLRYVYKMLCVLWASSTNRICVLKIDLSTKFKRKHPIVVHEAILKCEIFT